MRKDYKIVDTAQIATYHVVSPSGERILSVRKLPGYLNIEPLMGGIGDEVEIQLDLTQGNILPSDVRFPSIELASAPLIEKHYKRTTTLPERLGARLTGIMGNPLWAWLYGGAMTVAAIWGWIDQAT